MGVWVEGYVSPKCGRENALYRRRMVEGVSDGHGFFVLRHGAIPLRVWQILVYEWGEGAWLEDWEIRRVRV